MASNEASSSPNNNRLSTTSVCPHPLPSLLYLLTLQIQTTDNSAPAELSAVVDELLNSLSNKFAGVSSEIFAKSTSHRAAHAIFPLHIPIPIPIAFSDAEASP